MGYGGEDRIGLTEHAFIDKVQIDPDFRQALVLDTDKALAYYRISSLMESKMRSALGLLDALLGALVVRAVVNAALQEILMDRKARRVLLFAPREASVVFGLPEEADHELMKLSAQANALFESILASWPT